MASHSSTLAWQIPWTEEPGGCSPWGCKELGIKERLTQTHTHDYLINYQHLINSFFPSSVLPSVHPSMNSFTCSFNFWLSNPPRQSKFSCYSSLPHQKYFMVDIQ